MFTCSSPSDKRQRWPTHTIAKPMCSPVRRPAAPPGQDAIASEQSIASQQSKQHKQCAVTAAAAAAAAPVCGSSESFLRTVAMQHVQSHYAEQSLGKHASVQKSAGMQPMSILHSVPLHLAVPSFVPLLAVSPESSCSSISQGDPEPCAAGC